MTGSPRSRLPRRLWTAATGAAVLLAAPGCDNPSGTTPEVTTIVVTAPAGTLAVGQTLQLSAQAYDQAGDPIGNVAFNWSTSDAARATVEASGVVTGRGAGAVTITGRDPETNVTGTVSLLITPPPVNSVSVAPAGPLTLQVGQTQALAATPRDAAGNPLTGRTVTWSSSNAAVASVSPGGVVTALAAGGPVAITATVEGVTATVQVTVIQVPVDSVSITPAGPLMLIVGGTQALAATAFDAAGNPLTGRPVTWSTSNAAVASVSPAGVVTVAAAGGPVTITATVEGVAGTVQVTVTPVPVDSVSVSPAGPLAMEVGQTQGLTATAWDAAGNPLTGRPVTWSSSNSAVASVSGTGVVTAAGAGGPVTITANVEGVTGAVQVTVTPVPVDSVSVAPAGPHTLEVGETVDLDATAWDAAGNPLSGRTVTWSSSSSAVASVSGAGVVTGVAAGGPVTITANVEGVTGTAQVTVTQVPVDSVSISPPGPLNLHPGQTQALTATAWDAVGNPLTGRPITWTSSNQVVAPVSPSGVVTAQAEGGPVTITANVEGVAGTAQVTVTEMALQVIAPTEGQDVGGDSLLVVVEYGAPPQVNFIRAKVGTRTTTLSYSAGTGQWQGKLSLVGLAYGTQQLRVTGVTPSDSAVALVNFDYVGAPSLVVNTPVEGSVGRPSLRVQGTCTDDESCTVAIRILANTLYTGTGNFDVTLSLAAYEGTRQVLVVTGTDPDGQFAQVRRTIFVESQARLVEIGQAGVEVIDAGPTQLFFRDSTSTGVELAVMDLPGGTRHPLRTLNPGRVVTAGYLASGGATFALLYGVVDSLYDWRGGSLQNLGRIARYRLKVTGDWATWHEGTSTVYRRNLSSGVETLVHPGGQEARVAANGDVAFTHQGDVYWYRNDGSNQLLAPGSTPQIDGTQVVYWGTGGIMRHDGTTETDLTPPFSGSSGYSYAAPGYNPEPTHDYAVNNGWLAFRSVATDLTQQVFSRAPDGTLRQVSHGTPSRVVTVGPNGEVVFAQAQRRFYSAAPYTTSVDVGADWGTPVRFVGGVPYTWIGRMAFRMTP